MPNYCENGVTFTSTRKRDIERLRKRATSKDNQFDFNGFIPYPYHFKCLDKLSKMREKRRGYEMAKKGHTIWGDMPQELKDKIDKKFPSIKDGFNQGGYEWCSQNWGTKWNACEVQAEEEIRKEDKTYIWSVSFDTAWSPPLPIYENIAKRFPKINIGAEYEEEGCQIKGELIYENGVFSN